MQGFLYFILCLILISHTLASPVAEAQIVKKKLSLPQQVTAQEAWNYSHQPGAKTQLVTMAELKPECEKLENEEERQKCLSKKEKEEKEDVSPQNSSDDNLALVDSVNALARASHSSSGDNALIVFAVIGVVVLIVWIPYVLTYLYQWTMNEEKRQGWWQLEFLYTAMTKERLSSDTTRSGGFLGVRGSLFMGEESGQQMILVVEGGRVGFNQVSESLNQRDYQASYLMAGPGISYGVKESHFGLQIVGGTADSKAIGLLSKATGFYKINFNPWLFSLDLGALYSNIHTDRGAARDLDGFQFVGSIGFGLGF